MKFIFMLMLICASISVHAKQVTFNGHIEVVNGQSLLTLSLKNTSKHAVCFQEWNYSVNQAPVNVYSNDFIIKDNKGSLAKYIGPLVMPSSLERSYRYYVLSPGSKLDTKINLRETYLLSSGKYSLTYFLSVVDCLAFSSEQITLESSLYLKSVYLQNNFDADSLREKINSFNSKTWRRYGNILMIDSLEFEIP
jgi:hypothetical protein